jgi:hypothetical protein
VKFKPQEQEIHFGPRTFILANERTTEHFRKVEALHATFHVQAGIVLLLFLDGQPESAQAHFADGGLYSNASVELNAAMQEWLRATPD